jgi:hypothetical protein
MSKYTFHVLKSRQPDHRPVLNVIKISDIHVNKTVLMLGKYKPQQRNKNKHVTCN